MMKLNTLCGVVFLLLVAPVWADGPALPDPPSGAVRYGCNVTSQTGYVEVLDAQTGKPRVKEAFKTWTLRLWARDKKDRETWHFGPVTYASRAAALDDCGRWLDAATAAR